MAGKEFGVPSNGVVKTFQFLVEPLLVFAIYQIVYLGDEDLDHPLAPLVLRVRSFIRAVRETEGDANHLTWEVGVGG